MESQKTEEKEKERCRRTWPSAHSPLCRWATRRRTVGSHSMWCSVFCRGVWRWARLPSAGVCSLLSCMWPHATQTSASTSSPSSPSSREGLEGEREGERKKKRRRRRLALVCLFEYFGCGESRVEQSLRRCFDLIHWFRVHFLGSREISHEKL